MSYRRMRDPASTEVGNLAGWHVSLSSSLHTCGQTCTHGPCLNFLELSKKLREWNEYIREINGCCFYLALWHTVAWHMEILEESFQRTVCTVESLVLGQEEDQWTCSLSLLCMWSNVEINFYEGFRHIFISKILEWMTNIVWFLFKEGKSLEIEAYIMMLCIKGFYNLMMYWGLQLSLLLVENNDTGIWSSDFKNLLLM